MSSPDNVVSMDMRAFYSWEIRVKADKLRRKCGRDFHTRVMSSKGYELVGRN